MAETAAGANSGKGTLFRAIKLVSLAGVSWSLGNLLASSSSFLSGFLQYDDLAVTNVISPRHNDDSLTWQQQAQTEFQAILHHLQSPPNCSHARLLWVENHKGDGFTLEFQFGVRQFQVAVATRRTMYISPKWKSAYEPNGCVFQKGQEPQKEGGYSCLWQPPVSRKFCDCNVSSRTCQGRTNERLPPPQRDNDEDLIFPTNYGILVSFKNDSVDILQRQHMGEDGRLPGFFFDSHYYGPHRIQNAPNLFTTKSVNTWVDKIAHWERAFGRYWIRCQLAHFLWKPSDRLQEQIQNRLPLELRLNNEPFIGIHIRLTDNVRDLERDFGRHATLTRTWERFLAVANLIREEHVHMELSTLYVATDNLVVAQRLAEATTGPWKIILQKGSVKRATDTDRIGWFRSSRKQSAAAIATDVHVLKHADFLIGSFQSNVYRLAAQLNTAWHVGKHSIHKTRHFTVDVEYYEDP